MQLDQAQIAIHERSWSANLDLALHVLRRHAGPIALCAVVGILPFALVNHLLLAPAAADEFREGMSGIVSLLVLLVMIEAPLATSLVTIYLGQTLFTERTTPRAVLRTFIGCLPQMLLLQFLLRAVLILPVVTWILPFGSWPYLSEIILLERNPLVSRGGQLSTSKRSYRLHRGNSSQFMLEGLGALCVGGLLLYALVESGDFLATNLFGVELRSVGQLVMIQASMWIIAVLFAAARFLNYLNQRIHDEGWEVELLLKAERDRLERPLA